MKIGIVSAHYMPEVGYQEVHLAKAYSRMGHTVKVFSSDAAVRLGGEVSRLRYKAGLSKDEKYGFDILRLPALSFKSKAISFKLQKEVLAFKPDLLIILGVAKVFPRTILNEKVHAASKMVSFYGDAYEYLEWKTLKQKVKSSIHQLGFATLKKGLYRRAVRHCDRIVMNYPETETIISDMLNQKEKKLLQDKKLMLHLGYDNEEYFYDPALRKSTREKLNIKEDEVVLITSTRINPRKELEQIISYVSDINRSGKKMKYILVGFLGDTYEKKLKSFIQSQPDPSAFICFPFLGTEGKRELYNAADMAIWQKVSISVQEALGTGLPVLLENKTSQSHLVKNKHNGWYYDPDKLKETLEKAYDQIAEKRLSPRETLAKENASKYSYDNIAVHILNTVLS